MQEESREDFGSDKPALVKYWMAEYNHACKREKEWVLQGEKVVKKFEDDRPEADTSSTFNILWSNTETLAPAMYSRTPVPVVTRRFKDDNPLGIQASRILQRALEVSLDSYDFDAEIKLAVQDVLLPGRGQVKVRYIPTMGEEAVPLPTDEMGQPIIQEGQEVVYENDVACCMEERVVYEEVKVEYQYWKHFKHGPGRIWREVPWVAYDAYMSRDQGVERFGEIFNKVKLDYSPDGVDKDEDGIFKQAHVIEIWSIKDGKTIWISPSYKEGPLDVKEAPLKLHGGIPSPSPLLSIKTSKSLIPIPEYKLYQDQAQELNNITARIDKIVDAIKVRGLYAGDAESVPQLLEGENNALIPVDDWMAYIDKGGIDNLVHWLPVDHLIKVLSVLYEARDKAKEVLYELTGISDIVRGASNPNETLGAQKIKGRYAAMRFDDRQKGVATFVRDILRLKAEVIAEQFSPKTLQLMTGMEVTDEVMELLRNDPARSFMIDIETDSTIAADEMEEKQRRTEFLTAVGGFMKEALPVVQAAPEMKTIVGKMLLFAVRGFRAGRELEDEFMKFTEGEGEQGGDQDLAAQLEQAQQRLAQMTQEHEQLMEEANKAKIKAEADIKIANNRDKIKQETDIRIKQMELQAGPPDSTGSTNQPDIYINTGGGSKVIKLERTQNGYVARTEEE